MNRQIQYFPNIVWKLGSLLCGSLQHIAVTSYQPGGVFNHRQTTDYPTVLGKSPRKH